VPRARESCRHGTQLAKDLMPFFDTCPFLRARNASKDFIETFDSMQWEMDGHVDSMDHPPKDKVDGVPTEVTLV
jgi:hypothetical protein